MEIKKSKNSFKTERSIYELIVEAFPGKIPIVKNVGKSDGSVHTSLRVKSSIHRIANRLAAKSKRFQSQAEVFRAGLHMGVSIIYHLDKTDDDLLSSLYRNLLSVEEISLSTDLLDTATESFSVIFDAFSKGIINEKEAKDKVNDLISALPKKLQPLAEDNCALVFQGDNVRGIFNKKTKGRPFEAV